MSNYKNFVSDFPARCAELLAEFEPTAQSWKREVTRMLCVAMPSIVVPLERLGLPKQTENSDTCAHPSQDSKKFEKAKSQFDCLLKQPFRESILCLESESKPWYFGELSDESKDPDDWPELKKPNRLGTEKEASTVLKHIRNALAHGNIFTRGHPDIEQIIFLSKPTKANRFCFLAVEPEHFRDFLKNWLEFLKELDLSEVGVSECAATNA